MPKKTYTKEFKTDAVNLVREQNYTIAEASRRLEISESMLGKWVHSARNERDDAFRGNGNMTAEQKEIHQLREENRHLKMEKEILKKATVDSIGQCNSYSIKLIMQDL